MRVVGWNRMIALKHVIQDRDSLKHAKKEPYQGPIEKGTKFSSFFAVNPSYRSCQFVMIQPYGDPTPYAFRSCSYNASGARSAPFGQYGAPNSSTVTCRNSSQ